MSNGLQGGLREGRAEDEGRGCGEMAHLERDELHPIEGVGGAVDLRRAEGDEQAVGDELDVHGHHLAVHADEIDGQRVAEELLLVRDGIGDDLVELRIGELLVEHRV